MIQNVSLWVHWWSLERPTHFNGIEWIVIYHVERTHLDGSPWTCLRQLPNPQGEFLITHTHPSATVRWGWHLHTAGDQCQSSWLGRKIFAQHWRDVLDGIGVAFTQKYRWSWAMIPSYRNHPCTLWVLMVSNYCTIGWQIHLPFSLTPLYWSRKMPHLQNTWLLQITLLESKLHAFEQKIEFLKSHPKRRHSQVVGIYICVWYSN